MEGVRPSADFEPLTSVCHSVTFSPPKVKPFKLCSPSCHKQEQNESPEQELI